MITAVLNGSGSLLQIAAAAATSAAVIVAAVVTAVAATASVAVAISVPPMCRHPATAAPAAVPAIATSL